MIYYNIRFLLCENKRVNYLTNCNVFIKSNFKTDNNYLLRQKSIPSSIVTK